MNQYQEWRDIQGYEGYYQVSNHGNVKSLDRLITMTNGRTKKLQGKQLVNNNHHKKGYKTVVLCSERGRSRWLVHRLVAIAFISGGRPWLEVNHKDKYTWNNDELNLEWMTHQQNMEHGLARFWNICTPSGKCIEVYNLNKYCKENNLGQGHMSAVANGKEKQHKGYTLA